MTGVTDDMVSEARRETARRAGTGGQGPGCLPAPLGNGNVGAVPNPPEPATHQQHQAPGPFNSPGPYQPFISSEPSPEVTVRRSAGRTSGPRVSTWLAPWVVPISSRS
jgi:hypothetical protein